MTPDQVRAARKLLGWSVAKLGFRSDTSPYMVKMFEQTGHVGLIKRDGRVTRTDTVAAVRATLEAAGVEFTNEEAPGVRLRNVSQG